MNALIARIGTTEISWVGTSMGGIIGMVLASVPKSPIKRLIINDIGPEVPRAALESIEEYIGKAGEFEDLQSVEAYLRKVHHEFAPMSDEDWAHMARTSARRTSQGTFRLMVDNKVGDAFHDAMPLFNVDMWDAWQQISCPVLILRGAKSTFLTEETARKMLKCGPQATLIEFEDAGHAPTLRGEEQIGAIADWLENH